MGPTHRAAPRPSATWHTHLLRVRSRSANCAIGYNYKVQISKHTHTAIHTQHYIYFCTLQGGPHLRSQQHAACPARPARHNSSLPGTAATAPPPPQPQRPPSHTAATAPPPRRLDVRLRLRRTVASIACCRLVWAIGFAPGQWLLPSTSALGAARRGGGQRRRSRACDAQCSMCGRLPRYGCVTRYAACVQLYLYV
eukprot:COSAG01_NODE_15117_length_1372_cov_5.248233_1_plen_196_part_00